MWVKVFSGAAFGVHRYRKGHAGMIPRPQMPQFSTKIETPTCPCAHAAQGAFPKSACSVCQVLPERCALFGSSAGIDNWNHEHLLCRTGQCFVQDLVFERRSRCSGSGSRPGGFRRASTRCSVGGLHGKLVCLFLVQGCSFGLGRLERDELEVPSDEDVVSNSELLL
jgi:hypothetical protein